MKIGLTLLCSNCPICQGQGTVIRFTRKSDMRVHVRDYHGGQAGLDILDSVATLGEP